MSIIFNGNSYGKFPDVGSDGAAIISSNITWSMAVWFKPSTIDGARSWLVGAYTSSSTAFTGATLKNASTLKASYSRSNITTHIDIADITLNEWNVLILTRNSGGNIPLPAALNTQDVTLTGTYAESNYNCRHFGIGGRLANNLPVDLATVKIGGFGVVRNRLFTTDEINQLQAFADPSIIPDWTELMTFSGTGDAPSQASVPSGRIMTFTGSPTLDLDTPWTSYEIDSIDSSITPGTTFSFTTSGFATLNDITANLPGLIISNITGVDGTANINAWSEGLIYPELPASAIFTYTDGSNTSNISVDIDIPANYIKLTIVNPELITGATIGKAIQLSGRTIQNNDIFYYNAVGNTIITENTGYSGSTYDTIDLWLRVSSGIDAGKMFNYTVNIFSGYELRNGNTVTVTTNTLPTATNATINSRTVVGLSGNANSYLIPSPTLAPGIYGYGYGSQILSITDGTITEQFAINVLPLSTQTYVTLTSVGTGSGHIGNYITCAVGDQIVYDLPATLAVTVNGVTLAGAIQTDYSGTQTMWHIRASDGLVTELTVITPISIGVVSVNSGVVYVNGSTNTITTVGLPTANGATLGSYPISGLTGSNNSYSFTLPTIANGVICPLLGNRVFTITDGTNSPTLNINVLPSPTLDFITLSGNGGTSLGYVGNTITCVAGDQIIFSKPATLSITENGVRADGSIFTDYNGTQTMCHRRSSDGLITEFSVLTSVVSVDTTPNSAVIIPVTNAVLSQSYTSTGVTVSGMDAGIDVACTITGGTYEISTDGGSNWNAPASIAGTIRNGHMFRLTGTASNLNNTVRNVVFSVGEGTITNFTFVITTVAAPRTINLANKLVRNLVSPLYDTKVTTSKTETVPNFIPGNNTTLLHSNVVNNTSVWLLNVPNFTTATIKLKQNITKAKGNIQVQINNTTGLSVGNNKLYLCKLNASNAILTFKRVNINIT